MNSSRWPPDSAGSQTSTDLFSHLELMLDEGEGDDDGEDDPLGDRSAQTECDNMKDDSEADFTSGHHPPIQRHSIFTLGLRAPFSSSA